MLTPNPILPFPRRVIVVSLFWAALLASLFFQGFQSEFLVLSLGLLILLGGLLFVWQYAQGLTFIITPIGLTLSGFWLWLGLTALWSQVSSVTVINVWWFGALPLSFWLFTLAPERCWRFAAPGVLALGVGLSLAAIYQALVLGQAPTATFIYRNSLGALLVLIALPASAAFLIETQRARLIVLGICLGLLFYTVGLIQGRGVILCAALALTLLFFVARRQVPRARLYGLVAILVIAGLAANWVWPGSLATRMETVLNPVSAGSPRFIIWQQSWELLKDTPWWGSGYGTYSLLWPPYRHPLDSSAGYYVHNDYLQIWIEAGLPGLILLLIWLLTVAGFGGRALWRAPTSAPGRVELAGVYAGLMAVALHSFLDFNLYVLTTLIVAGFLLARLQALMADTLPARSGHWQPANYVGRSAYPVLVGLVCLFPLVYFAALSLSSLEYRRGIALAEAGALQSAQEAFLRAERASPDLDNVLITHADLLRHVITSLPTSASANRHALYAQAQAMLNEAQGLNAMRPLLYMVRAELIRQNPDIAGEDWVAQAMRAYQQALVRDPRFYPARLAQAKLLLTMNDRRQALQVLEEGLRHWYPSLDKNLLPFYELAAALRRQAGDEKGAEALAPVIESLRLRPAVAK